MVTAMTLDELKVLLALNGNVRIPHLETEIFTCKDLYTCYLENVCSEYEWYTGYNPGIPSDIPWLAYLYARFIIKCRWDEAESVIATSPKWLIHYATHVIEGRWPEAEHIIATDPMYIYWYARDVIKDRWPETEHIIASNRKHAEWYNEDFGTNI